MKGEDKFNAFSTEPNQLLHKTGNPREAALSVRRETRRRGNEKWKTLPFPSSRLEMAKVA